MGGGAWSFLVGGAIYLVNSVNERDLNLLTSYVKLSSTGSFATLILPTYSLAVVLLDNRLDNGNLVNPYESWVHTMRSHRHKRYKPTALRYNPAYKKIPVLVHNGKTGDELLVILKNIDEGRKQAPLLPKDPYQKVRACFWAKLGFDISPGCLHQAREIAGGRQNSTYGDPEKFDIAGLKIVHEERLPLLSAWIQDFADAQIIKDNWPPQAQMLANCHALLDASCTAAASK
ncbi:Glutathione S-transferase U5 [Vitis vinifera]|uniref:Glutathione S-transferase n=1 Tax=Vitis vinifera TaxID=29760 RepID=A0A438BX24_VITVI|nr:Glutathione S-transferase U5 [Vitis vinifera]